jgi:hypothetical protein
MIQHRQAGEPGLPMSAIAVNARILRTVQHLDYEIMQGFGNREFDVLSALRRTGPPGDTRWPTVRRR